MHYSDRYSPIRPSFRKLASQVNSCDCLTAGPAGAEFVDMDIYQHMLISR